MAEIREIAIGLATVLKTSREPEPLPITLRGQSLADAALLVRCVIRECSDAGVSLHKVEGPPELLRYMRDGHLPGGSYLGVQLIEATDLGTELRFYRKA